MLQTDDDGNKPHDLKQVENVALRTHCKLGTNTASTNIGNEMQKLCSRVESSDFAQALCYFVYGNTTSRNLLLMQNNKSVSTCVLCCAVNVNV